MNLGHIAISVSSLKKSSAFYCRFFGLRPAETYAFKDKGMKIAMLRGAFTLELFEFARRKPLPSYRKALGTDLQTLGVKHFSVETKDVEGRVQKIQSGAGEVCGADVDVRQRRAVFFRQGPRWGFGGGYGVKIMFFLFFVCCSFLVGVKRGYGAIFNG
jgi:catechol 2,3-dioxygenase-like lactoylglutathione lyase family enzyme